MSPARGQLTIVGDIGVDLVLGPVSNWPRIGTEALIERSELRGGGSAGNAALAAHYLGGDARLVSGVGSDHFGSWLSEQFQPLGASLEVCDSPTSLSVGVLHSCGERSFLTTRGHLELLSFEMLRPRIAVPALPQSIALLSGVFLMPALRVQYARLIRDLCDLGYQVALDTNWPPQDWTDALRSEVASWIAGCQHVMLNELEVSSLANCSDLALAINRLAALLKPGATLVVKKGAHGAIGIQNGQRVECPAPQATIFDTIGAGDSFNAGYLMARLQGAALADALAAGCNAATAIISRFPRRSIRPGELANAFSARRAAVGAEA